MSRDPAGCLPWTQPCPHVDSSGAAVSSEDPTCGGRGSTGSMCWREIDTCGDTLTPTGVWQSGCWVRRPVCPPVLSPAGWGCLVSGHALRGPTDLALSEEAEGRGRQGPCRHAGVDGVEACVWRRSGPRAAPWDCPQHRSKCVSPGPSLRSCRARGQPGEAAGSRLSPPAALSAPSSRQEGRCPAEARPSLDPEPDQGISGFSTACGPYQAGGETGSHSTCEESLRLCPSRNGGLLL